MEEIRPRQLVDKLSHYLHGFRHTFGGCVVVSSDFWASNIAFKSFTFTGAQLPAESWTTFWAEENHLAETNSELKHLKLGFSPPRNRYPGIPGKITSTPGKQTTSNQLPILCCLQLPASCKSSSRYPVISYIMDELYNTPPENQPLEPEKCPLSKKKVKHIHLQTHQFLGSKCEFSGGGVIFP